jgi:four helix bundle protein
MKDFRSLKVWEKSHSLVLEVYRSTTNFPKEEMFGLTSQVRRAASSIPANIAEGCGRGGEADFARFLQIAMGSASELEYHILLAHDLGYLDHPTYQALNEHIVEVKKMLASLIGTIKK